MKIQTAEGERKVEDPAIGDLLPTMFGGPVRFNGSDAIQSGGGSVEAVGQGRAAGSHYSPASAPNVPHADLYVTRGHSSLIDGVLVPAEVLINGTTITRYEAREYDELEFFHIKLESHDVVYAEGAPAETLLNVEESAVNFADYLRQHGTTARDEDRCAPHIHIWGGRIELKSRLRSALSPWIDLRDRADVVRDELEERGICRSPAIRDRPLALRRPAPWPRSRSPRCRAGASRRWGDAGRREMSQERRPLGVCERRMVPGRASGFARNGRRVIPVNGAY